MNWYAQREGANDSYFLSANRLAMGTYHAMSQFCFSARIWDFYKVEYLSSHCITVTDLANFCATPLFRRPQGSQGCLEKQNYPLSSNLVVWCAKIGPKTKKVNVKNYDFSTVFQSFSVFGPILAHQTTKFKLSG